MSYSPYRGRFREYNNGFREHSVGYNGGYNNGYRYKIYPGNFRGYSNTPIGRCKQYLRYMDYISGRSPYRAHAPRPLTDTEINDCYKLRDSTPGFMY